MSISIVKLGGLPIGSSEILEGEVSGSVLTQHLLAPGQRLSRKGQRDRDSLFFVVSGGVDIASSDQKGAAPALTLIRFPYGKDGTATATQQTCLLEIGRILNHADRHALAVNPEKQAALLLRKCAECPTYREDIKSEKTVNRMLLPEGSVPRLCMGTVQTQGPDDVGAHEHPMLDQLFLGLSGCRCTVHADHDTALLEEGHLLHVPLASRHRVSVAEGDLLHYMWIDFFETLEGEAYIAQAHTMDRDV